MSPGVHDRVTALAGCTVLFLGSLVPLEGAEPPSIGWPAGAQTNVAGVRQLISRPQQAVCVVGLEGTVLWSTPTDPQLVLQDETGGLRVEMKRKGHSQSGVEPGDRVRLEGSGIAGFERLRDVLIDNDGLHSLAERSESVSLPAGLQGIRVAWFNGPGEFKLEVQYEGPDLARQAIPDAALFRAEVTANGTTNFVPGLEYRCYEGEWDHLPDFRSLQSVKRGHSANFDLRVRSRDQSVGLEFTGYVSLPRAGLYTFRLASDDGAELCLGEAPLRLALTGAKAVPVLQRLAAHQILRDDQPDRWSEVEGTVTFVNAQGGGLELELNSGTGRMHLDLADGAGASPWLLLHSRIRARGICQRTYTTDGQQVAGTLLVPAVRDLEFVDLAPGRWADVPTSRIASLAVTNFAADETVVHVRGRVLAASPGQSLLVADETGQVLVEASQATAIAVGGQVEALGRWSRSGSNVVLRCGCYREIPPGADADTNRIPLLTTIEQVKRLSREEAQRGYPVRIRGVITAPQVGGFFIQDATWSIYVRLQDPAATEPQRAGDYWEAEGVTFAEFAPNVRARRAVRLGAGTLPEPQHPTWDQLINGSLDTQYVEVQGIVTAVEADGLALLTPAGKVKVQLSEAEPSALKRYESALVRLRGCVIPARDLTTQQVELGRLRLSNFSINVDEPAPADPFAAPLKRALDLRLFDAQAGALQRVKLAGQFLHEFGGQCYLREGTNGLRFVPRTRVQLRPGDLVEVVGFPELGGPSPVLQEAIVRRTGDAPLPVPDPLTADALVSREHDARLVRVEARLVGLSVDRTGQVLELQAGTRGFVARLDSRRGELRGLAPGSRIELTGVYAGRGGDLASGREIDSFELLLNSPAGVRVLERPPWWTLRHTLAVIGGMALVILVALVWITLLRRQVEERSRQLTVEIQRHERTERQRALEEERARIAQDLHDDLGATLTQIRFLSALESRDAHVPETTRSRLGQVTEKSREMVASLDEIVWAVNPANDSLPSLATYLCLFGEEFFRSTSIRCRLDVDDALPPVPLTSEVRHHLYLAVREAINNIAKHSQATEVWLRIQCRDHGLVITLEDNGRGFAHLSTATTGDGLANMRQRLEKVGGQFECQTRPGAGTICRIWMPLVLQPPAKPEA